MSVNKKRLYKERLTKEALFNLSYKDTREFEKKEDEIAAALVLGFALAFVTFVSIVAMIIWFNKVTLFITIVIATLLLIIWRIVFKTVAKYLKSLNKLNGIGTSDD